MKATDQIKRAGLMKTVDYLLEDPEARATKIMDMIDKVAPANLFPSQRLAFRDAIEQKSNWYQLIMKIADLNPAMRDTFIKNFLVDGNLMAWGRQEEMREKYQCNIPWAILLDPTSACNLHCIGCWASDYGHKLNLSYEDIDSIINQGVDLGVHIYIYTGGEPLVRKRDLMRLCEEHQDCTFLCFTNATLIDEDFCQDLLRVKNFVPAISAEGFEETTDARRGEGVYQRIVNAMALLKEHKLPFGISACLTSQNAESVGSEEYFDWLIDQGALFCWVFTYMPVGVDSDISLMPTVTQRRRMYDFIRAMRKTKPLFTLDFQNDGEYVGGCIAGGRRYLHINAAGDVEPCVLFTIQMSTFTMCRCSKRCARRSSWNITRVSPLIIICCALVPCSRIRIVCQRWSSERELIRPICRRRKRLMNCARSVIHLLKSGRRLLMTCGTTKVIRNLSGAKIRMKACQKATLVSSIV